MKTITDVMICPKCGSDNTYEYSTDEIEFCADGTGHYYSYCSCGDCRHNEEKANVKLSEAFSDKEEC